MERMATDRQWAYIKILMRQAFAMGYKNTPNIDVHHMPTYYTMQQAASDLAKLLEAKKNGWK